MSLQQCWLITSSERVRRRRSRRHKVSKGPTRTLPDHPDCAGSLLRCPLPNTVAEVPPACCEAVATARLPLPNSRRVPPSWRARRHVGSPQGASGHDLEVLTGGEGVREACSARLRLLRSLPARSTRSCWAKTPHDARASLLPAAPSCSGWRRRLRQAAAPPHASLAPPLYPAAPRRTKSLRMR